MAQADFTRIASNIGALNALYSLRKTNSLLGTHQTRLATGRRINSAEEDPAGLSIATKMNARSEGLKVALDNIGDAKNMLSVAEAGLQKISDILVQMRTKAEQAASDTLGSAERAAIQSQLNAWAEEINSIVATTKWNGQTLLDGLTAFQGTVTFQVGADTSPDDIIQLTNSNFGAVTTTDLAIGNQSSSIANWTQTGGGQNEIANQTVAVNFSNLNELATGSYTLVATVSKSGSTATVTLQLRDAANNVIYIDADGTNGGLVVTQRSVEITQNATVDLGVGVKFDLVFANIADGESYTVTFDYIRGGTYNGNVMSASGARAAMDALDAAIDTVSARLRTIGAVSGRLSFREETLSVAHANTEAAFNRIMNADMAYEQVEVTKLSILQQTSLAMLSQANMMPQNILSLFR
jgi:flagellin